MDIGGKIRDRCYELGYSQERLAFKVGVCQATINNWENNKSYPPMIKLEALAQILGLKLSSLISDTDTDMWRMLAEERGERCGRLEKTVEKLLKENQQLRKDK